MQYSDKNLDRIEKRLELLAGPAVVAIFTVIICAVLLARATGL